MKCHSVCRDRLEEARASVSSLAGARQLSPSCSSESESSADEADQSEASIRALDQSETRVVSSGTNERQGMGRCQLTPGHQRWSLTRLDIRLIESHI